MHRQILAALIAGCCVLAASVVLLLEVPLSRAGAPGIVERFAAFGVGVGVAYGVLASALMAVRPGHPLIRWWLAIAGLAWVATLSGSLGLLGVWTGWPVPAPEVLIWVGGWIWVPVYWLIPTAIFALSPDGHLPSVRWRPFFWLVGVVIAMTTVGWMLLPVDEIDGPALLADGAQWPVSGWASAPVLVIVGSALGVLAVIAALAALVARYRSATAVDRARLRWLVLGAAGTLAFLAAALLLPASGGLFLTMAAAPFPLSVCAAVLGAGLWDIDVLVNRTLVYSGLLVSVAGVYVVSVVLLGQLLGQVSGAPLAATVVVAVIVVPLKVRLERSANRIVYGQREDPNATLAALVVRLDAAAHAEDAVTSSLETLVETLPLQGASVVTGSASWMAGEVEEPATTFELALRGATLGRLSVQPLPGVRLGRSARSTLRAVAGRLALIVHSEEITAELLRSRARLVAARDEERHRISVDLHDGIGPSLAALGLQSHRAHDLVRRDPDAAQRALEGMAEEIRRTVADVRAIVAGMAPGELEANGLAACLPALIERFDSPTMAVELTCDLSHGDELPVGVEIAAYNVVAEALANAVAHSGAGRCTVAVSRNGRLEIDVVDDGSGLPSSLVPGIGIASMRRRVEACEGSFTIGAGPAGGTVVRARLPVSG